MGQELWVEKYRPSKIEDCILPVRLKDQLTEFVKKGEVPGLLFAGTPGTGKTTAAKALCNELGCDFMVINGSDESGIDTVRNKIKNFASTVSVSSVLSGIETKHKVLIMDEADYLNPNSAQPALRGMIEEFWKNCRFIFTCNYKNRLIPAIHSRCSVVDFSVSSDEKVQMMASFMKRVMFILKSEGVEFDKQVLASFIQSHFPDFRRTLNELQRYSACGKIDNGILKSTGDDAVNEIVEFLKEKNFKKMRVWVDSNSTLEVNSLFDKLYDSLYERLQPSSIPDSVLILDEYQNKAAVVVNQRINLAACFTQMMGALQWK